MPLRDHWWCILVANYGAFLFTEISAFVITDYNLFCYLLIFFKFKNNYLIFHFIIR